MYRKLLNKNESSFTSKNIYHVFDFKKKCTVEISTHKYLFSILGKGLECPVKYYKCEGNIVELNKLVSGFYSGQQLDNGDEVNKPTGLSKCSHGGILDKTAVVPASGFKF